ncbi:sterol desaturase family protein [Metallibacterium scheffleri]
MKAVSIEHSKVVYFADFAFYFAAVVLLLGILARFAPRQALPGVVLAVVGGVVCWSLVEYLMHRVIFHGIEPFQRMHGEHHRRPQALIATPTALSAVFILLLVWLPATLLGGVWLGLGATLGMTAGYFAYGLVHHALHHWRSRGAWMRRRKRLHALHHHAAQQNYGVTTSLWDHVFRSYR